MLVLQPDIYGYDVKKLEHNFNVRLFSNPGDKNLMVFEL